jgi:putative membrane protein
MKARSLKSVSALMGGVACFSIAAFAGPAPVKSQSPAGAAAPTARDSMDKAKTEAGSAPGAPAAGANNTGSSATPGAGAQTAMEQFSDAEILGNVLAVDDNEIAAASAAKKKKISPEAKTYAKMLQDQHKENAAKAKKLGKKIGMKPAASTTSKQLRSKGAEELTAMSSKNGTEFEKAYIDAMVNGHTEALRLIDDKLVPSARNEDLKAFLAETRGHVAAHLEEGKRLQGSQASSTGQ